MSAVQIFRKHFEISSVITEILQMFVHDELSVLKGENCFRLLFTVCNSMLSF